MNRLFKNRQIHFYLLRCSSASLATILLTTVALLVASLSLKQAGPGWLVLLSIVLLTSLLCVMLRVAPLMWRELTRYRKLQQLSRLQSMRHYVAWRFSPPPEVLLQHCRNLLLEQGYVVKQSKQDDLIVLTAMRGRLNRLGFILSHGAALLILLGLFLDSDLSLRYQIANGKLVAQSNSMPLNEMSSQNRIGARSALAFQGYEQLLTGQKTDEVRVSTSRGSVVRHLPFAVAINAVELDADQLLQESNFLTQISILDPRLDEPVRAVLGSNRPFHYRGLDYYQQSVTDGASELTVSMWPLVHASTVPLKFRTQVGTERQLQTRQGTIHIVFADLKPRNVLSMQADTQTAATYKNIGPSLFYTINDESGSEREFVNYMLPVLQDGRYFFISGYRDQPDRPYQYIHLPVDTDGSPTRFLELHAALYDSARIERAIDTVLAGAGKTENSAERDAFKATLSELLQLFKAGGFAAVQQNISQRVEKDNYQQSMQLSYKLLRSLIYAVYKEPMKTQSMDETRLLFFEDALPVLSKLAVADMPFYIQLQDMDYKPVVNLLVSYKPGETLFFAGCLILLFGLLASFYTYHRRIWMVFKTEGEETIVSIAGMGNRQGQRFTREFNGLFTQLQKILSAC